MDRDVYVVGVGIHRFGKHDISRRDMAYTAGIDALEDAGLSFRDVGALYTAYIGGNMLDGVTYAKDLGLTGIPVVHVENASATGSSAFRLAVNDVSGGVTGTASPLYNPSTNGIGVNVVTTATIDPPTAGANLSLAPGQAGYVPIIQESDTDDDAVNSFDFKGKKGGAAFQDESFKVTGCGGFAESKAKVKVTVETEAVTGVVTIYGKPFSLG